MTGEQAVGSDASESVAGVPRHILRELGFGVRSAGDDLVGEAGITEHMLVPGTAHLRTSILAVWTDLMCGLLAARTMTPKVPVTLELDVHLYRPAPAAGLVRATARTVKAGRSVFAAAVDFSDDHGEPLAIGAASFMSARDPLLTLPPRITIDVPPQEERLTMPFAERAGCRRTAAGVATMSRAEDGLNSSNTMNGGLIALVAEEAALSVSPGDTLCTLDVRYLQPVRVGPVEATAAVQRGLGRIELRDTGNHDRLAVVATSRAFGSVGRDVGG
jgi:acyl-coenzyme A thioesterase PaaI-like protein